MGEQMPKARLFPGRWMFDNGGMIKELTRDDMIVWIYINHRQGTNVGWQVSISRMVSEIKISRSSVQRSIRHLIKLDLLEIISGQQRGRANRYIVLAPEGAENLFKGGSERPTGVGHTDQGVGHTDQGVGHTDQGAGQRDLPYPRKGLKITGGQGISNVDKTLEALSSRPRLTDSERRVSPSEEEREDFAEIVANFELDDSDDYV